MSVIRSIEGLRGIAALLVALFHVYVYGKWGGFIAASDVLRHAWLFVDLFFVISGFVMAANYQGRIESFRAGAAFMVRRFFRLYPLHIVTTASVLLAVIAVQTAKLILLRYGISTGTELPFAIKFFDLRLLGLDLTLLQGVGIMRMEIHNYPSWSISVEFWLYLIFALFMLAVRSSLLRIVASLVVVGLCIWHFNHLWALVSPELRTLDTRGLPRGLLSFFQGVLVYYVWSAIGRHFDERVDGGVAGMLLSCLQLVALAFALVMVSRQETLGVMQLAIPTAFAALVIVLLPDRGLVAGWLNTVPIQWLGRHSYSIYLIHITVQTLLDWPGRKVPEPYKHLVGLLFLALVFGLSALTYRYVEVPWRERGKRLARRIESHQAPAAEPAAGPSKA